MRILLPILTAVSALLWVAPASAKDTVECLSKSYKYNECYARSLEKPVLIYQSSNADCIMNRTWGFSPRDNYIWVDKGCSGVFASSGGYHYGESKSMIEARVVTILQGEVTTGLQGIVSTGLLIDTMIKITMLLLKIMMVAMV